MKPAKFDYVRPRTLAEATAALGAPGGNALAIAGGQSLIPMLALRLTAAQMLVDIGRLESLHGVHAHAGGVRIGAAITHAEIEDGAIGAPMSAFMRRVASGISYRAVRNHGTIGGSLALADPAADWPVALMVLGADVAVAGPDGERCEPVAEFITGIYATSLRPGEIITAIELPTVSDEPRWGWATVARKSGAFASSIAGVVRDPKRHRAQVVIGGLQSAPRGLRRTAELCSSLKMPAEDALRALIGEDLAQSAADCDAYQKRLHTATLLRAVRESYQ